MFDMQEKNYYDITTSDTISFNKGINAPNSQKIINTIAEYLPR